MTDQEIADVTDYVRTAWSNAAPVIQKTGLVGGIRARTVSGLAGPGAQEDNNDPCRIGPNSAPVSSIDDPQVNKTLTDMTPESMLSTIPTLIARVGEVSPDKPQADVINGLCSPIATSKPGRQRFSSPRDTSSSTGSDSSFTASLPRRGASAEWSPKQNARRQDRSGSPSIWTPRRKTRRPGRLLRS
jgi:hypothetical protein